MRYRFLLNAFTPLKAAPAPPPSPTPFLARRRLPADVAPVNDGVFFSLPAGIAPRPQNVVVGASALGTQELLPLRLKPDLWPLKVVMRACLAVR
jgi:hypothetical protein